jgi:tetratricopeptide (TPR) repeat protein
MRFFVLCAALVGFVPGFITLVQADTREFAVVVDSVAYDALPAAILKSADSAYADNLRGLDLLDSGKLDAAQKQFDKALARIPNYTDAQNNRGVVYYRRGEIGQAREIWHGIIAQEPDYALGHYNLGIVAMHQRDNAAALAKFQTALKLNRRFVEALQMQGKILLAQGRQADGLESYRKGYEISPDLPAAWGSYASALLAAKDTAKAESILLKNTKNADAAAMLARIYRARNDAGRSATFFNLAIVAGGRSELFLELAEMQFDSRRCTEALEALKAYFARMAKPAADAWVLAGVASKECGNQTGSMDYFRKGLEQYLGDPILRYNLGLTLFQQKKYAEAETIWASLSDSLAEPSLYYCRALAARYQQRLTEAEKLVRKAIALDKKAEYYDLLGAVVYAAGRRDEAIAAFKQALVINPELSSARLNCAVLEQAPEQLGSAIDIAANVFDTCRQDCAESALRLSILYYYNKQIDKAIATLERIPAEQRTERTIRHAAIFYRENQQWSNAIAILEYAAKSMVLEPQTEAELAECYLAAGDYDKAIDVLKRLVPRWPQKPWRLYYQIGYAAMQKNDLTQAQDYFQRSLREKPDNVAARGLLAFVLNRQGKSDQARVLWERNLKDDPDNPAMWINMGLLDANASRYTEALDKYQKALLLKPTEKELYINIGNAYTDLRRYREAADSYDMALESSKRELAAFNLLLVARRTADRPRADKMYRILTSEFSTSDFTRRAEAEIALWDSDTTKALGILEKLAVKDESDWYTLASIYVGRGLAEKAHAAINHIPESPAWKPHRQQALAVLAFHEGRFEEAIGLWKGLQDTSFAVQYNIALAAYQLQRYAQTLQTGERLSAGVMGRDRNNLCRLLGNAAFQLKDWKKARACYLQLSGLESQNAVVQYNLAVAAYNLNDITESWKYYQRAREIDPTQSNADIEKRYAAAKGRDLSGATVMDSTDIWYNQAIDLQDSGADSLAEKLYTTILNHDSAYVQAWNNLGAIYAGRGELAKAEDAYRRSIERRHNLPEAYANLVNVYIAMQDFKNARYWLSKGRFHNPESDIFASIEASLDSAMSKKSDDGK